MIDVHSKNFFSHFRFMLLWIRMPKLFAGWMRQREFWFQKWAREQKSKREGGREREREREREGGREGERERTKERGRRKIMLKEYSYQYWQNGCQSPSSKRVEYLVAVVVLADGRVVHAVRVALSFSLPLKLAVDKRRCRVLHDAIVWPRQDKVSGEEAVVDQVASSVLEEQNDQKREKTNAHVSLILRHHVKIKAERRQTPDILCLFLLIKQTQKVEFSPLRGFIVYLYNCSKNQGSRFNWLAQRQCSWKNIGWQCDHNHVPIRIAAEGVNHSGSMQSILSQRHVTGHRKSACISIQQRVENLCCIKITNLWSLHKHIVRKISQPRLLISALTCV